jgi:tetratricopeptide (TPR) repeat protein
MVNTTLRAYLDELNLLLEQEALEEVIGHCRHILQHYPKNVESYRFLGRALLEKKRHAEAADVFQRVLSALPDDFVSHLGLSSVSEEQGQLPAAIWHLERAYEQEPNNMALQGELQRLYERRDGTMPARIQMTHGALVRIYAKGNLFEQAIHELQMALAQAPDRIDLSLLLADVLWSMDRPIEAGEVALRVLEKLPDSIEANRLMATLWLKSGRPSEAAPFVSRLEQLDPFVAWQTVQGKPVPSNAFQLPRLDWDAKAAAALATDVPDWVNAISNVFEAPDSVSLGGANNWLEEAIPAPEAPRSPLAGFDVFGTQRREPAESEAVQAPVELPDWMEDAAAEPASPAPESDVPDWFKDSGVGESETGTTLPDWFEEAVGAPEETPPVGEQLPSGFTDLLAGISNKRSSNVDQNEELPPIAADLPDWMSELEAPSPAEEAPAQALDAMSWLATESPALPEEAEAAPQAEAGGLDWLGELPAVETPAEAVETPPQAEAGGLDWPSELPAVETPAEAVEAAPQAEAGELDWLSELPAVETPAEAAPQAEAGELDWLSELPAVETPAPESVETAAEEVDWFASLPGVEPTQTAETGEPVQPVDNGLDWLDTAPEPETAMAEVQDQPQAEETFDLMGIGSESAALDWMAEGAEAVEEEPQIVDEGDPLAWLRPYQGPEGVQDSAVSQGDETALAEASESELAQTETPPWLSAMAPTMDQPPAEAAPLDTLDFGSLQAEPETQTSDWLSSSGSPEPEKPAPLDWLSEPAAQGTPTEESALELEEDWLASFEGPVTSEAESAMLPDLEQWQPPVAAAQTEEPAADNWQSSFEVQAADSAPGNDWFASLAVDQPAATEAVVPTTEDWLGSLSVDTAQSAPDMEPAAEAASGDDDWFAALGAGGKSDEATGDMASRPAEPESPPETAPAKPGTGRLDALVKQAAERPPQSRVTGDTGVLDAGAAPDWLTVLGGEEAGAAQPAVEAAFDSTEQAGADWFEQSADSAEPGDSPAWLSDLAPASQPAVPAMSLDELDFGSLDMPSSEEPAASPDVPAWMADLAPAGSADAKPLDELDFGSLESTTAADTAPAQATPDEFDFSGLFGETASRPVQAASPAGETRFDPFAEPANMVNTGGSTATQKEPAVPSFNFDRPPAWKRKTGGKTGTRPSSEDLPDWLKGATDAPDSQRNDLPDWLR